MGPPGTNYSPGPIARPKSGLSYKARKLNKIKESKYNAMTISNENRKLEGELGKLVNVILNPHSEDTLMFWADKGIIYLRLLEQIHSP